MTRSPNTHYPGGAEDCDSACTNKRRNTRSNERSAKLLFRWVFRRKGKRRKRNLPTKDGQGSGKRRKYVRDMREPWRTEQTMLTTSRMRQIRPSSALLITSSYRFTTASETGENWSALLQ